MVSATSEISREIAGGRLQRGSADDDVNVGSVERWLSLAGGGLLTLYGLSQRSAAGLGLIAVGGGLLYRGLTGHCPGYSMLNINTATEHNPAAAVAAGKGFKVVRAITVNRPVEEVYRRWRNLEGLPQFMSHLRSVKEEGKRSHWVAKGPAGMNVEWDAEIINEEPKRLIAWRSLEGSEVSTAGSVHFTSRPGGGTEVLVTLKYDPPGGKLGSWLAETFGEEPSQQIREDLHRFKQQIESSGTTTTSSQASRSAAPVRAGR